MFRIRALVTKPFILSSPVSLVKALTVWNSNNQQVLNGSERMNHCLISTRDSTSATKTSQSSWTSTLIRPQKLQWLQARKSARCHCRMLPRTAEELTDTPGTKNQDWIKAALHGRYPQLLMHLWSHPFRNLVGSQRPTLLWKAVVLTQDSRYATILTYRLVWRSSNHRWGASRLLWQARVA